MYSGGAEETQSSRDLDKVKAKSKGKGKSVDKQGVRREARKHSRASYVPDSLSTNRSEHVWDTHNELWYSHTALPSGDFKYDSPFGKDFYNGETYSTTQAPPRPHVIIEADQVVQEAIQEERYGRGNQMSPGAEAEAAERERDVTDQKDPDGKLAASHQPRQTCGELSYLPLPHLEKLSIGDAYESGFKPPIDYEIYDQSMDVNPPVAAPRPQSEAEKLRSTFQSITEPSRFFKVGRVFKVLWTEPAGADSNKDDLFLSTLTNGLITFTKVRRFIVVKEMRGCCLCLPIVTYDRQATTKSGVNPENYAAVYDDKKKPYCLAGELLQKSPFPITIETLNEHVDPMSRLDFGRVYTIEHNLKVLKVGRIPITHLSLLQSYFVGTITGMHVNERRSHERASHLEGGLCMQPDSSKPHADKWTRAVDDMDNATSSPLSTILSMPNSNTAPGSNFTLYVPEALLSQLLLPKPDHVAEQPSNSAHLDELDPRYRVAPKSFWRVGRVFMVFWTEPAAPEAKSASGGSKSSMSSTSFGSSAYTTVRRFVVMQVGYGSSICSPISSYAGQATLKPNLPEVDQHAIIYTQREAPREKQYMSSNGVTVSENLTKEPIRVVREQKEKDGELTPTSRLNYSKVYTVEHNVPVLNIGIVHQESMRSLLESSFVHRTHPSQGPTKRPPRH